MSTPLAIGAVTAALRNLIDSGFVDANLAGAVGASVAVSAIAPDLIDLDRPNEPPRLNIFFVHATPNAGWRNQAMPWHDAQGRRSSNPPLALDLHYVITAYARGDAVAEMLLGTAMHLLHERPRLTAAMLAALLDPGALPPTLLALADTRIEDQAELLRITPVSQSLDEASKLWSALQSQYRPSAAYDVSVVLIEAERPTVNPLPVLSRGVMNLATGRDRGVVVQADMGPPLPTLFSATPLLTQQSVLRLGDTLRVTGVRLAGSGVVARLTHRLHPTPLEMPVTPNDAGTGFDLVLPNDAAAQSNFIPGVWQLSLRLTPPGEANPRETNAVALLLSADPVLANTGPPLNLAAATAVLSGGPPQLTVTMRTRPQVRPEQTAVLMLDATGETAEPRTTAASPLVFRFPNSVPAGNRWVRLRVDGVDSPLVLKSGSAPVFDNTQRILLP